MNKKKKQNIVFKDYCYRCGSYDVKKLSTGELLCKNPKCGAISKYEWEENSITLKLKLDKK